MAIARCVPKAEETRFNTLGTFNISLTLAWQHNALRPDRYSLSGLGNKNPLATAGKGIQGFNPGDRSSAVLAPGCYPGARQFLIQAQS